MGNSLQKKIRIWMEMDLAERGGVESVSKFCPVKGSTPDTDSARHRAELNSRRGWSGGMGGACRMAGVAVATPTSLLPHQHFTLLSLLATPKAHQIYTFNVFGHTIFENDSPPMSGVVGEGAGEEPDRGAVGSRHPLHTAPSWAGQQDTGWAIVPQGTGRGAMCARATYLYGTELRSTSAGVKLLTAAPFSSGILGSCSSPIAVASSPSGSSVSQYRHGHPAQITKRLHTAPVYQSRAQPVHNQPYRHPLTALTAILGDGCRWVTGEKNMVTSSLSFISWCKSD